MLIFVCVNTWDDVANRDIDEEAGYKPENNVE